ncbi:hypothetical protein [Streptomyces sp. NBC_01268]|uniref:hypothetical protein n=1 Tax=Streptomyces sp. NBC_01268 TaxID=2903806 RepID=UPI002E32A5D0|nr:hypothetical protein [Streptomyces sp. NBC_01268]
MSQPLRAAGRTTPYAALFATLSVLLSLLLPTGAAWAAEAPSPPPSTPKATSEASRTPRTSAPEAPEAPAAEDCSPLALARFGGPGAAVGKASLAGNGTACFTFTAERSGMHRVLLAGRYGTRAAVFDGETELDCYDSDWGPGWCALPRSGAFTLRLDNGSVDPDEASVTVTPLASDDGCLPETGTSWDQEPLTGSLVSPLGLVCRPFAAKPGERITHTFDMVVYGDERGWITDETGGPVCDLRAPGEGCVLPGDGPYRVIGEASGNPFEAFPVDYRLKIRRLSDPEGCATVPVNAYGSAPTIASPATGCKTFTVPVTGDYDVYGVAQPEGQRSRLRLYDRAGTTVCEPWSACRLTSGVLYTATTDDATLILRPAAADGCETVSLGALEGRFTAPGEIDCLTLPLPENAHLAILKPSGGPEPRPDLTVVRADGGYVCGEETLIQGTCVLTGQGPFRAVVSTDDTQPPTGAYRLVLYRTDAAHACPVFPAGDFTATSAAARLTTGDGVFSGCLSIPADAHSTSENMQISSGAGAAAAQYSVLDTTGRQVCQGRSDYGSFTTCALTPGLAHTVLLAGSDTASAYTLVRRDVTATAKGCAVTPATAVGGPSSGGALAAPGALLCRQVTTGDAGDVLHLDVRDPLGTANVLAYDASGSGVPTCGYRNKACAVTGSTRYQVVLTVPAHLKAAAAYRFDALRIGTPEGPAPECTRAPDITYGYGPIEGVLDEQHTAACLSLPTAARDRFDLKVADTAGRTETGVPALYDASGDNGCFGVGASAYQCYLTEGSGSNASPSTFVLGLPEKAARTDYSTRLDCWSLHCGTAQITIGDVSPTSAQGGKVVTLTVTGTALGMRDYVRLTDGSKTLTATTVSVSPDARTLTATLDLRSVGESSWNVSVIAWAGWAYQRGTFTVTKPAPSALGTYKPLTPTRLMDTRTGVGVRKGKVGPDGTVTLQVAGNGGVPATGVGAVVLNVTATGPTAAGFVSVFPDGTQRTSASNLNFKAGQTIPNLVIVPVVNGKVSFYNRAGSVDLLADVAGYYVTDGSGATYRPVTPTRLMDTRTGLGVPKAKVGAAGTVTLQVTGKAGVPSSGVTAVVLNVTATGPTAAGFVSVFPDGTQRTSASNLNFTAGTTIPNLVVVPVVNGKVSFYNHSGSVDLLADVSGYFTTDGTGSAYKPIAPTRLMDTRSGLGVPKAKVGPDGTVTLAVAGTAGIPATGVTAVVLNVTAVAPTAAGFVSVFPDGTVRTSASNLNFTAGTTIPNLVVVPVVNGKVGFYNKAGSVDLLADVAGYYVS